MWKLKKELQNQLKDEEFKKDAEDCIEIYRSIKEANNGLISKDEWDLLVRQIFAEFPRIKRIYKPSKIGYIFLNGIKTELNNKLNNECVKLNFKKISSSKTRLYSDSTKFTKFKACLYTVRSESKHFDGYNVIDIIIEEKVVKALEDSKKYPSKNDIYKDILIKCVDEYKEYDEYCALELLYAINEKLMFIQSHINKTILNCRKGKYEDIHCIDNDFDFISENNILVTLQD